MNIVSISGRVANDSKVFPNKNGKTIVNTIANDTGKYHNFIPVTAFAKNAKALNYFEKVLTKGQSVEIEGQYNHSAYQKNGAYINNSTVIIRSARMLRSNNFNMNSAIITGNLVNSARFAKFGNRYHIFMTVASDDYNRTTYVNVNYSTQNQKVVNFYKNNAQKGRNIEIMNGYFNAYKHKDNNGNWQDNSTIETTNAELGYASTNSASQTNNYSSNNNYSHQNNYTQTAHASNPFKNNNQNPNFKKVSGNDLPF